MSAPTKLDVPWISRIEFLNVYYELYSDDLTKAQHAVDRIKVWKARSRHSIPVAVDSTFSLVNCELNYQRLVKSRKLFENYFALCGNFGLAIIRFVNDITEKGQTSKFAVPIHELGEKFGLPEWIIDVRHSATHGHMPSLDCLRIAAKWALGYLEKDFWRKWQLDYDSEHQDNDAEEIPREDNKGPKDSPLDGSNIDEEDEETMDFQEENEFSQQLSYRNKEVEGAMDFPEAQSKYNCLRNLFIKYQQQQFQKMKGGSAAKISQFGRDMLEPERNQQFKKFVCKYRKLTVSILMEEGMLLTNREQLEAFNIDIEKYLISTSLGLPPKLLRLWQAALKLIHKYGSTSILLQKLTSSLTEECTLKNKMICCWIHHIVKTHQSLVDRRICGRNPLCKQDVPLPLKEVFDRCMRVPNYYGVQMIKLLANCIVPRMKEQNVNKIVKLYEMGIDKDLIPTYVRSSYAKYSTRIDVSVDDRMASTSTPRPYSDVSLNTLSDNSSTVYTVQGSSISDVEKAIEQGQNVINSNQNTDKSSKNGNSSSEKNVYNGEEYLETEESRLMYESKISNIWKLCKDNVNWRTTPIGVLPNQILDYQTLELSCDEYDVDDEKMLDDTQADAVQCEEEMEKISEEQSLNVHRMDKMKEFNAEIS